MYVNISPADYNLDETLTSLAYAARVKLITNDAAKNEEVRRPLRPFLAGVLTEMYLCNVYSCQEILRRNGRGQSAEVHRLKEQIKKLQAGGGAESPDLVDA
eukprot:COSAG01_NODE_3982_length_5467_cov_3.487891_3_plen_101_part_00